MKTSLRLLAAVSVLSFASFIRAGDLQSQVIQATQSITIDVPGNRFLTIRNFTQDATTITGAPVTIRGVVSVMTNGLNITNAFVASIADPNPNNILDPVNNFVVAGAATVTVTCGDTNCFITFRKGTD
jgi:hypothetical protein